MVVSKHCMHTSQLKEATVFWGKKIVIVNTCSEFGGAFVNLLLPLLNCSMYNDHKQDCIGRLINFTPKCGL